MQWRIQGINDPPRLTAMPAPINAPRYHVVRTPDGKHVAMCSVDGLNSFPVGLPRAEQDDAISDCVRLSRITSQGAPLGVVVWRE